MSISSSLPLAPAPKLLSPVRDAASITTGESVVLGNSVLHQSLAMSDDLSALVAALARHRRAAGAKSTEEAPVWIGQVLEDDAGERYIQFRGQLIQKMGSENLRELLFQLFPDPSDAVLVIRMACEDELLDQVTKARLRDIEMELLGAQPKATKAGINVAQNAAKYSRKKKIKAKSLRNSYRSFLDAIDAVADQYEGWITEYGFEHRGHVVDFLESALATDMYALDPSCGRIEFGNVMSNMRSLCVVRSADDVFLRDIWSQDFMSRISITEEMCVTAMFSVVRRAGSFDSLFAGDLNLDAVGLSIREKAIFLQRVRRGIGNIPHEMWEGSERYARAAEGLDELISKLILIESGTATGVRIR